MSRWMPSSMMVVLGAIGLAALVSGLVIVLGGSLALGGADREPFLYRESGPAHELREKLAQRINLDRAIEPGTTLQEALEFLSMKFDLNIIVDDRAFAAIGIQKVGETSVQLPKLKNEPLHSVLRLLVGQIRGDTYIGAFQVRDGHVEITTTYHQFMSQAGFVDNGRPNVPNVTLEARGQNLEEAFAYLADATGINVVVDTRIRDRARKVTAPPLRDVPLDTALRFMADMADLGVAITDNVFYITDVDNARVIRTEQEKQFLKVKEGMSPPGVLAP